VLSHYPITIFDRTDGRMPRWPTFGVRLSARPDGQVQVAKPVRGPISLVLALVETLVTAKDAIHIEDPCAQVRTIFVDTSGISSIDFDVTPAQRERLLEAGQLAAERFLASWDFDSYLASCRGVVPLKPQSRDS